MRKHDALLALGFKTDDNPSMQSIKKAYKRAALKHHPDKLCTPKGASKEEQEALKLKQRKRFDKISLAYDCLLNPNKKEHKQKNYERGPMTPHEYMSMQHGYSYTSQYSKIYGDKSQKYNIAFYFDHLDKNQNIVMETLKTDYFYFDTVDRLSKFCNFLRHKDCFRISLVSSEIPEDGSKLIVDALLKNFHIMEVEIYDGFLCDEQHKRLKDFLYERNYPTRLMASRKKVLKDFISSSSKIGGALGSILLYNSTLIGFISIVSGYYVGSLLGDLRYKYLDYAVSKCYFFDDKPDHTKDSELEALKIGANAKSWVGYFSSYTRYASNRHPLFFAAGLKVALDEDEKALPYLLKQ